MVSYRKGAYTLTTRLTAGECIDRLRRISERDDGDDSSRHRFFALESLLLAKTRDGFSLGIRGLGWPPFAGALRVRFETSAASGERLKLVGRIGPNTASGIYAMASFVAVLLALAWWTAFREHLIVGLAVAAGTLGLSFLIFLFGRALFEPDYERLFEIVKDAVDGDGWRAF